MVVVPAMWSTLLPILRILQWLYPVYCLHHIFQVLLQWRYTASLRVYHRQQKVAAVMEARKHLDAGELMGILNSLKKLSYPCTVSGTA